MGGWAGRGRTGLNLEVNTETGEVIRPLRPGGWDNSRGAEGTAEVQVAIQWKLDSDTGVFDEVRFSELQPELSVGAKKNLEQAIEELKRGQ